MSIVEVLLLFAGVPIAVYLLFVAGVYLPGFARKKHYRPGQAWEAEPVWFVPQPDNLDRDTLSLLETGRPAIEGSSRPALTGAGTPPAGATAPAPAVASTRGGARGDW
ncbi:MAG: aa3-type cytochrome oxidase subunit CtaJ [Mycobacteriales bacterium]